MNFGCRQVADHFGDEVIVLVIGLGLQVLLFDGLG